MIITIDTSQSLSTEDKQILQSLISRGVWPADVTVTTHHVDTGAPPTDEVAKKRKAKPTPTGTDAAVAKATQLMADGKKEILKAALKQIKVERVTLMTEDDVQPFLDAVEELDA